MVQMRSWGLGEFKVMIEVIRIIDEAKGSRIKKIHSDEKDVGDWTHQSDVTKNPLPAGHVLSKPDLTV